MSDSISKLYDEYKEYESFCKRDNITPKNMWHASEWLDELSNFKNPEFKKGDKYMIAEKLKIGRFKN